MQITRKTKKNILGLLAVVLTAASLISLLPAAYASGETASEYNISQDLDASGKWKYRNLVPGEGNENSAVNQAGYVCYKNSAGAYAIINNDEADKVDGNYSWKADLNNGDRVNVFLDTSIQLNKEYYLSTWIKHDYGNNLNMVIYTKYKLQDDANSTEKAMPPADGSGRTSFDIAKGGWLRYQNKFMLTVSDSDGKTEDANFISPLGILNNTNTSSTRVNVNLDDLSFRLIPDWTVNSLGAETLKLGSKNVARWTFDKDIDKWTCTKELFAAEGCTIDDVTVTTDENTRKTTLDVRYTMNGVVGRITLPEEIKDAWGRGIEGISAYKTVDVSTVTANYDSTAASELDASGKWKYRNLLPEEGEESTTISYTSGAVLNNGATALAGKGEAHSGAYSWSENLKKGEKIRVYIDPVYANQDYYVSMWLKSENTDASKRTDTTDDDKGKANYFKLIMNRRHTPVETESGTTYTNDEIALMNDQNFASHEKWEYFTNTFQMDKDTAVGQQCSIRITNTAWADGPYKDDTITLCADDWSFSLIPSWDVYCLEKETLVQGDKRVARWTFDKDIDKWTCTKDLFTVDGCSIDDVTVTTDEKTRITTLDVAYTMTKDTAAITLPEGIKDAWGRAIKDLTEIEKTATINANSFDTTTGAYTIVVGALAEGSNVFAAAYDSDELIAVKRADKVVGGVAEGSITAAGGTKFFLYAWTDGLEPLMQKKPLQASQGN